MIICLYAVVVLVLLLVLVLPLVLILRANSRRKSQPKAAATVASGLCLKPGESVTLALSIPLDGGVPTCVPVPVSAVPPAALDRMARVDPDDFRRTGDILRCCAGLMDEAATADSTERVKLLCRMRNLTEHWFGVIGLDAARKEQP